MKTSFAHAIPVRARSEYRVYIEKGILSRVPALLRELGFDRVRVVTDRIVEPLYGQPLLATLQGAGLDAQLYAIDGGEAHKTLATCGMVYRFLSESRADRGTAVLALGGGVVGDLVGFAAATYMRGLPLIHVPTTLLAQVDSSVGSKVAVDLPEGKNLVGAFYDPVAVVADPDVLGTLPLREVSGGMAEVIKAGLLASPGLFNAVRDTVSDFEPVVVEAVRIKAGVVTRDPFEKLERMKLNLGHTVGHAIETVTGYSRYTHGECVAMGMMVAARLSQRLNILEGGWLPELEACLSQWKLPTRIPSDVGWDGVLAAMGHDKKRAGRKTRFIAPRFIGDVVVIDDVDLDVLRAAYQDVQS